jgi:hypothetical protein
LQDTAFYILNTVLKMRVTGIDIRPGVNDGDNGLAIPFLAVVAHLHGPRTVAGGADIIWRKPAAAAQTIGALGHRSDPVL